MASVFTEQEILDLIAETKTAISAVLLRQSYTIDTGMGKQTVTYASLPQLRSFLGELQFSLEQVQNGESPFVSISGFNH